MHRLGDMGGAMLPPPEGVWGMPPDILNTLRGYDPDVPKNRAEARQIMEKLGYGPGKRLVITNVQIRAARALLGWDQARLAKEADVSVITIKRLEAAEHELPGRYETVMKVKRAVENAGVEFLGGGDRIGVVRVNKGRKK